MQRCFFLMGLLLILVTCKNKEDTASPGVLRFSGIWTIQAVYANDHWGGPLYWRNTDSGKQIKFTTEGRYYEKTKNDFHLIGTFKIISANQIEFTWDHPMQPEYPTYQLNYEFDNEGRLTLTNPHQFEGIVAEQYTLSTYR